MAICHKLGSLHLHLFGQVLDAPWGWFWDWKLKFAGYCGNTFLIVYDPNLRDCDKDQE